MCKHVAAALYGVGARLDENPALFFTLRNVNIDELISKAIAQTSEKLLNKSGRKSKRIIENDDLSAMFDIEIEDEKQENGKENAAVVKEAARQRGRRPRIN